MIKDQREYYQQVDNVPTTQTISVESMNTVTINAYTSDGKTFNQSQLM